MDASFNNNTPIYLQIIDSIKTNIISGKLKPGEKLLSVREYANHYKVNPNTMQKALMELEDIKLIYTERTSGKYVTTDEKLISTEKNKYAKEIIKKYFENMENIGVNKNNALNYLLGKEE